MTLTTGVLRGAALVPPPAPDLLPFIDGLALHDIRLIGGCGLVEVAERLATGPGVVRPVFRLDLVGSTTATLRESAIAHLALAVGRLWPSAWGGEDFAELREDPLSLAHLPIRLASLADRVPGLSQAWARCAVRSLLRGREPRVRAAPDLEWQQLTLMLAPAGLTLAIQLDPGQQATPFVSTVEWLAARAAVAVVVLTDALPPAFMPWARLLYGAQVITSTRLTPRPGISSAEPLGTGAATVLAAPSVEGRPHPLSAAELQLYRCIQTDAELQPLFGFNLLVEDASLLHAKVDLLWRAGRVAVEIDGADHRATAKYRADRERDHRLMCAGYRVLRLTNEEVVEDCGRAVGKIREVVRLAQRGWA